MTFDDDENIISVGCFSLERKKRRNRGCKHLNIILNQDDHTVFCDDCNEQLTPFFALIQLTNYWRDANRKLKARENRVAELEGKQVILKSAKSVELAWRGPKKMAVSCPHCKRGILAEDGLGNSVFSRELELARRKKEL